MGQTTEVCAVLDDGTGVYLWNGDEHRLKQDWIFMALFRCERCGRTVTVVRFDRENVDERRLFRMRACPGGCESIQNWLSS